jgi:hypothetical protein
MASVERRRPLVAQVELTCAFLAGNQWTKATLSEGVKPVDNPINQIRVVENRMLPAYVRWMYYLQQEKPVVVAHEGGREVKDARHARVASTLFEYCESMCGWKEARVEMAKWVAVAGAAFIAPAWRPELGRRKEKRLRLADAPRRTDSGLSFLEDFEEDTSRGDVAFEVYNPIQTHTFPQHASSWQKVRSVVVTDLTTREDAQDAYPAAPSNWDATEVARAEDFNLKALDNSNNYVSNIMGSMADPRQEDRYLRLQCWDRPSRRRPRGRYRVYVGTRKVVDQELPFVDEAREIDPNDVKNLTMGIVPWFALDFPGRLIPPAPFGELIPFQTRINDLLTDQVRNRKAVGRNKILVEKGQLGPDQWTDEHGEVIEVPASETFEPKLIQGMPLAGLDGELSGANAGFDEATGQLPVLQGQNVPNVRGAFHFETIRQEAMKRIFATVALMEHCYELTGLLVLAIMKGRYSTRRVLEIYGQDYAGDAMGFKSLQIRTDVRLQTGSMIPRNKALYEEKLKELLQYGAFGKSGEKIEQYWQMSELGTMNRAVDAGHMVRLMAERENAAMLHGGIEMPIEWEDHDVHIEAHELFMGSSLDFKEAPDTVKAIFEAHHEEHLRMRGEQLDAFGDMEPIPGLGDIGGPPVPGGGRPSGAPAGAGLGAGAPSAPAVAGQLAA